MGEALADLVQMRRSPKAEKATQSTVAPANPASWAARTMAS
jgi:hypothetical protein